MSDCFGKLIIGITGLLVGSAELADGTRKRKTLSVALGLLTALGSIVLLCVCAYNWLTSEDTEIDDEEEDEEDEENGEVPAAAEAVKTAAEAVKTAAEAVKAAADTKADETAPAQEDAE